MHYCNSFYAVLPYSRGITLLWKTDKLENTKQYQHYTYNITMRRVHVAIVAVEKQQYCVFLVCVCTLSLYSMESACALLYCHLWPARL